MWVLTSFGALMPSIRPPKSVPVGDNRVVQVRARRRKDLDILRDEYMGDDLGPVITLAGTDYEFRAYCTREAWAVALAKIAMDIDYVSFKDTTMSKYNDHSLHNAYMKVWSTIQSAMATKRSYDSYWGKSVSRRHVKTSTTVTRDWWEDLNDDKYSGMIDTSDIDVYSSGPDLRPDGSLDHSMCDHRSKNARRRCRNNWKKRNH